MTMRIAGSVLLAICLVRGAAAHRLDEYLQATLFGVTRDGMDVEIGLTPGVAVLPAVMVELCRCGRSEVSFHLPRFAGHRAIGGESGA